MLTTNLVKAELSIAYLKAIAAVNRISCEESKVDMDSIDVRLAYSGMITPDATLRSPLIEVQLKASSQDLTHTSGDIHYSLPIKNYNDLRSPTVVPRMLVLLALPEEEQDWVTHRPEALVLRRCAYYVSLKGLPEVNNTNSVTVTFPKENLLDPQALKTLMTRVAMEEDL